MKQAEILYQQAVLLAEQGDMAKARRHLVPVDYKVFYEKASRLQKEAALLMHPQEQYPLTRGEMLKNAAALAYKADLYEEAQKNIELCRLEKIDGYTALKLDALEGEIQKTLDMSPVDKPLNIQGVITAANADEREIKIRDTENQRVYVLIVPANMFKKLVQSYWQERVSVVGHAGPQGIFTLDTIAPLA